MPAVVSNSPQHTPPVNNHRIDMDSGDHDSCSSKRNTYTHLTYSRHHLIDIAMETIQIAKDGQYTNSKGELIHIKRDLDSSVECSVHYGHEFDFHNALKEYDTSGALLGSFDEENEDTGNTGKNVSSSTATETTASTSSSSSTTTTTTKLSSNDNSNNNFGSLNPSSGTLKLSFNSPLTFGKKFPRTSFLVVSASWLESALELLGASGSDDRVRVGVLNSASGTTPGGRFLKGTVSQEDCLCRASLLYSCISQPKFQSEGRFYGKNRGLRYGTSNCVIFSPDVPVIREDSVRGKLLDTPAKVSFVTIPAPNAFSTSINTGKEYNDIESEERQKGIDNHNRNISICDLSSYADITEEEKFEKKRRALLHSLSDRIHRALSAFVLGGCTDLVLPAFGCGVHGNDPTMVANVFREMLTDQRQFGGRFRTVVFAIPPCRKQNYQAFSAYFQKQQTVERVKMTRGVTMDV